MQKMMILTCLYFKFQRAFVKKKDKNIKWNNLALINRAGGLYGRILTEVVSTDRTQ